MDGNQYNNLANGADWADFSNVCTFVQDAFGCQGQSFDITTDNGTGGVGPEVAILNAVGYDLVLSPEPGTLGLFGASLLVLAFGRNRLRRAQK